MRLGKAEVAAQGADLAYTHVRNMPFHVSQGREMRVQQGRALQGTVRCGSADTQPAELRALRELALTWMERLAEFRPHLAGAVWRGTATRHCAIHLDLYCDDSKSAEIALINRGIDYDSTTRPNGAGGETPVLVIASRSAALGETVTLLLSVLDHDDLRGKLKPDAQGRSWRGDTEALKRLLAAETSA